MCVERQELAIVQQMPNAEVKKVTVRNQQIISLLPRHLQQIHVFYYTDHSDI